MVRWIRSLVSKPLGMFWLIIPLYLWESFLEPFFPSTHALWGDWFNVVNYLTLFFYGFLMISVGDVFWKMVVTNRRKYLYIGIIAFSTMIGLRLIWADSTLIHFIEAMFKVVNLWAWILILFGYAAAYLNQPSRTLTYSNEAVYPFYILHQTITIAIGFYLMDLDWGFWPKFTIMVAGTFGGSWLIYECGIRRWKWIRPLFGMKKMNQVSSAAA